MDETTLAWHFVSANLRDGRPVPADGEMLIHDGELALCAAGLHASERLIDALSFAPGETVCRVRCGGEIIRDHDKLVCRERTILWRLDAADLLHEFARRCALDVAHLWDAPDIVLTYLRTGDDAIEAAARAAAEAAAMSAAWSAEAAWSAAWSAEAAAWSAARAAAWSAARDAQNQILTEMVERAHGVAP